MVTCRAIVLYFIACTCWFAGAAPAADTLAPLDLRQVKVGGEIGRRIDITIHNNLLALNAEKDFLPPFVAKKEKAGYIGLGKLIDSAVLLAAYSGDPKALALKNHLIEAALKNQEPDGYLGLLAPEHRMTGLWDVHEVQYIVWGLLQDYHYFKNPKSLEGAKKAADYLIANWARLPENWAKTTGVATHVAVTGLERTMLALHQATGDKKYFEFVTGPRALTSWNLPIVIGRRWGIEGHVYAYMARCLAQLELYRAKPAQELLRPTWRAVDFMTQHDGLAITGGAGQWEIWTDDQDGRGELGETCATAYQLRVYDALLRQEGQAYFGDLMERTIFNALFAAQSPEGRKLRYFSPTEGLRVYHPTDFFCCPCNYRRIVAELPLYAYYKSSDGISVNLYAASQAQLDLDGGAKLALRQETDYPNSGKVVLKVDPSAAKQFSLRLRIPAWAFGTTVTLNGGKMDGPITAGEFFVISRTWKSGDTVTLEMPMNFRVIRGRQRQAGRVAIMRGPVLFCLNPAQNKDLEKIDGADLSRLQIDPATLALATDTAVRPDGLAAKVQAWKASMGLGSKYDFELTLTEFPDPAGRQTYFRLRDMSVAVGDELLRSAK